MKTQTNIVTFLVEIIKRYGMKSPQFFRVLQLIGILAGLITGLPEFFEWLNSMGVQITLPDFWNAVQSKAIAIAGVVMFLMAGLPVDEQHANKTMNAIKKQNKLPFTSKTKK